MSKLVSAQRLCFSAKPSDRPLAPSSGFHLAGQRRAGHGQEGHATAAETTVTTTTPQRHCAVALWCSESVFADKAATRCTDSTNCWCWMRACPGPVPNIKRGQLARRPLLQVRTEVLDARAFNEVVRHRQRAQLVIQLQRPAQLHHATVLDLPKVQSVQGGAVTPQHPAVAANRRHVRRCGRG